MTEHALGTRAWAEATGGRLGFRDRVALVLQGVRAQSSEWAGVFTRNKVRHLDVDDILPPDTAICREATSLCEQASEAYLFHHCLRSYIWARLLNGETPFDDEAAYVAIILHDLGLTDEHRITGGRDVCFTLPAARAAEQLARTHAWSDRRAALVSDAICLHLNVIIGDEHGREAQLVRLGSGADVLGLGMRPIPTDQRAAVVAKYPRLDMNRKVDAALRGEARARPGCRTSFHYKALGFGMRVKNSGFAE